jgi:hypothetical protein
MENIWGEIDNQRGGTIRSYSSFKEGDFPESVPANITKEPFCITYFTESEIDISMAQGAEEWTNGITEFHLRSDMAKANLPKVLPFRDLIRNKAAANMQLNDKDGNKTCDHFKLRVGTGPSIEGPLGLSYGDESPHWGFIVHWRVFENTSGDFTISA